MNGYSQAHLLSRVQRVVADPLGHGAMENRVGDGCVAVRTDMGVPLLLVTSITHLWDVIPIIIRHIYQRSLHKSKRAIHSYSEHCVHVRAIFVCYYTHTLRSENCC